MVKKLPMKCLLLITIGSLLFITLSIFLFALPLFGEWSIRQQLNVINGASWVFEESARYGANVARTSIYYWIDRPLSEVRTYYQPLTTPFQKGEDDVGEWEIALLYGTSSRIATPDEIPSTISHGSLCNDLSTYDCVSITLVSADQAARHEIGVLSPSSFRRTSEPAVLAKLPRRGTIIVYSYYSIDY